VRVVYLHGEKAVIAARLAEREGHFMPRSLLDSQFAVLEEPDPDEESIRLETDRLVGDIVAEIVHELNPPTESRSPVIPQIKPNLKQASATVGARPSARATTSLRSDLPLAIEDYALIGDCITAALVGQRLHRLAVLAAFRQQRLLCGSTGHIGTWTVADPPRRSRAAGQPVLPRWHHGAGNGLRNRGWPCRLDRFQASRPLQFVAHPRGTRATRQSGEAIASGTEVRYGTTVPWVTQLKDAPGLSAIAGASGGVLRSSVALRGKNFATVAEFDVAEGECVPFVMTHGPSQLPPPAPIDWRTALQETESFRRAGQPVAATRVGGKKRFSAHC
jgi:hypothetical protein